LLERYYEMCSTAVEEHGGTIEKFIGDAIMAVFGTVASQEDDALRALRTAFQIRADVGGLRTPDAAPAPVQVHCGIAAGEAYVTRSARAGVRVVGDVVNLAARLQSRAIAGEILVSETVAHLARQHFAMTPVAALSLKGKAEPVRASRVTGPVAARLAGAEPRMVDRDDERARLRAAYHRVARDRRPAVVAVLGPPGIGKTRLVAQVVDELGTEPTVLAGSCPYYGANGTYVALAQVLDALLRQAAPCRGIVRANSRVAAVLESLRTTTRGPRDVAGPGPGVEEVSWVARELLAAAADRPLVVVWDGLEWAGPTLLELIGELAGSLQDVPVLMICIGRLELAERDVPWVRELPGGDAIGVGALGPADTVRLAASLAASGCDAEVQAHDFGHLDRISAFSAGNPLFIRLMVESAALGQPVDEVPVTITAMVGAMIDRLPSPARRLLGAASVVGPTFSLDQAALLDETVPAAGIATLVERQLVRATGKAGEYRIAQQPVHEVAYGRLEKEERYRWHRRLAEHGTNPAFHLEAAVRMLGDLRPDDAELPRLSRQAAESLLLAGTAALRQRDVPAAIGLLGRALDLVPGPHDRLRVVAAIRLSDALMLTGDTQRAVGVVTAGWPEPANPASRPCVVQHHLLLARLGQVSETTAGTLLAELADDQADRLGWCRFEQLRMLLHLRHGRFGAAERAVSAALEHARVLGDAYEEDRLLVARCEVQQWSPTPIAEKLASCAELTTRFAADRFLLMPVLAARARCLALTGDAAGARAALAEAATMVEQLRLGMGRILVDQVAGLGCALEGEHADAERRYQAAADALEQAGYMTPALTLRVQAARERAWQHPVTGAEAEITSLLERRGEMDVRGQVLCMSAAVRLIAGDGERDVLLGHVRSLAGQTDDPCLRGDAYFDLALGERRLGRPAEAAAMARAAIDSYSSVGATTPLEAVQAWM
jgi:tetratricopeptide (TPR) repeat protein